MDKLKNAFLENASRLDAMTDSYGEITKYAISITSGDNYDDIIPLIKKMSDILTAFPDSVEIKKAVKALKSSLYEYFGYIKINELTGAQKKQEDNRSLEQLLEELNCLIGLESVKKKVNDLIIYQKVQKMRCENDLHSAKNTLHMAFTGNPGTGKTTVARIVGRIYKKLGLLSIGHFTEVSRTDLIAGYQGQTALKVKKVIENAKGGVLFIDEAYSITENENSDSYGRECLTELTKALEDYREDLVVIVAGYTEPMNVFFNSNPGLKSRFNTFLEFDDYSDDELLSILSSMCECNDYKLSAAAKEKIREYFTVEINKKSENFANGRLARNIYEDLIMNQARRIVGLGQVGRQELLMIEEEDFVAPQSK